MRIDLENCFKNNITPTQFVYLYCLDRKIEFPWNIPKEQLLYLEKEGWIKLQEDSIDIRQKLIDFLASDISATDKVSAWIDDWRALWPSGVKSGNRPVKGDKKGCMAKMSTFVAENNYTKEQIFEATKIYIFGFKKDDYKYMTCADYFISKSRVSVLASFCEDVEEKNITLEKLTEGNTSFFKSI